MTQPARLLQYLQHLHARRSAEGGGDPGPPFITECNSSNLADVAFQVDPGTGAR